MSSYYLLVGTRTTRMNEFVNGNGHGINVYRMHYDYHRKNVDLNTDQIDLTLLYTIGDCTNPTFLCVNERNNVFYSTQVGGREGATRWDMTGTHLFVLLRRKIPTTKTVF
jgi:6-phosphogluconolactonase (cycloisomerase 2 family)